MRTEEENQWQKAAASSAPATLQQASEACVWSSGRLRVAKGNQIEELDGLREQIDDLAAERDAARRQVELLQTSLASVTARLETVQRQVDACNSTLQQPPPSVGEGWSLNRKVTTAAVVLVLGMLVSATTFRNAQSTVQGPKVSPASGDADAAAQVDPLDARSLLAATKGNKDKEKKPPPETGKRKTRFVRAAPSEHRQWGPPLRLTPARVGKTRHLYDPLVKQQQSDLLKLGFDLGEADGFKGLRTKQALSEFLSLYFSAAGQDQVPGPVELATILKNYANLAQDDANRFNIDRGVVAAIRLSSVRTGVDFSYLMELAAAESNFNPVSKAVGSSATGLYQFTHDTWLNTVKTHGDKYGLGDYAAQIEYYVTRAGYQRPMVRDEAVYQHLLDLRLNPRVSAMMAAETVRDSSQRLAFSFDREPARTDLYLMHFLGYDGAISFLQALDEKPDTFAKEMFPAAAKSNKDIFHPRICEPRTVNEVYKLFEQKFNTSLYD